MPSGPIRNLVTGGAGFLGSHLVDRLMLAGDEVLCLDNTLTGRKSSVASGGTTLASTLFSTMSPSRLLEVDVLASCLSSLIHYQTNPVKTAKTSFLGTYNMLGLAAGECSFVACVH